MTKLKTLWGRLKHRLLTTWVKLFPARGTIAHNEYPSKAMLVEITQHSGKHLVGWYDPHKDEFRRYKYRTCKAGYKYVDVAVNISTIATWKQLPVDWDNLFRLNRV